MKLFFTRFAAFSALLGGLALATACVSGADKQLDYKDNGSTIEMKTGETLSIELEGNPTTGYLWVFGAPYDQSLLLMTADAYSKPEGKNGMVGVPVKKLMSFKAMAPGRTGLKLDYRRPWERNEKPVKSFEVIVVISGKPVEEPVETDETPRRGSDGKVAKNPAEELLGK